MKQFNNATKPQIAYYLKMQSRLGIYDGKFRYKSQLAPYSAHCLKTGTRLIYTRDEGMHSGGWWKNPMYERCLHLSLSFHDVETGESTVRQKQLTKNWLEEFFGENAKYVWCEPPFSPEGIKEDIWHYRLFVYFDWLTPIHPEGEVYSKEFTEIGWKSFSELHQTKMEHQAAID